jgi:Macrocin-O-methyltransferase (TylF)
MSRRREERAMLVVETEQGERAYPDISDPFFTEIAQKVRPHTLTFGAGAEAPWALYRSIAYIVRNRIPGDIVECGVWSGGSVLLAALALLHFGDTSRRIYLYDTFAGMPRPDAIDARWDGLPALPTWERFSKTGEAGASAGRGITSGTWCVRRVIRRTSSCSSRAGWRTRYPVCDPRESACCGWIPICIARRTTSWFTFIR